MKPLSDSGQPDDAGLHWFEVEFEQCRGRCFITAGEVLHLRELNERWVEQALRNLANKRGEGWLQRAACTRPGLMLHHHYAFEAWGSDEP